MATGAGMDLDLGGRRVTLRPLCGADELSLPGAPPVERAAALLSASLPGVDVDTLTLGEFNRALLAICVLNFGGRADAVCVCPEAACGERMDVDLDFRAMLARVPGGAAPGPVDVSVPAAQGALRARLGPLRLADLRAAVAEAPADAAEGRARLLGRALEALEAPGGEAVPAAALRADAAALAALEGALLAADPLARVAVRGACPSCGQETPLAVEPMEFALAPLASPARLLDEVDCIARAYHWSEAEILSLPLLRRRAYLARIEAADQRAPLSRPRPGVAA